MHASGVLSAERESVSFAGEQAAILNAVDRVQPRAVIANPHSILKNIMTPTQAHKDWANYLRGQVGGKSCVAMYYDDDRTLEIPIFSGETDGGVLASTIGLMDYEQSRNPLVRLRTEILIDSHKYDARVLNVLSTIAFYVMKNNWRIRPGVIFEDMLSMYFPYTTLPHIYFTTPFQWDGISKVKVASDVIYPILAIPVSEAEADLANKNDGQDLESLWLENEIQVLDWNRRSSV